MNFWLVFSYALSYPLATEPPNNPSQVLPVCAHQRAALFHVALVFSPMQCSFTSSPSSSLLVPLFAGSLLLFGGFYSAVFFCIGTNAVKWSSYVPLLANYFSLSKLKSLLLLFSFSFSSKLRFKFHYIFLNVTKTNPKLKLRLLNSK